MELNNFELFEKNLNAIVWISRQIDFLPPNEKTGVNDEL
jgi:hypothetical protein